MTGPANASLRGNYSPDLLPGGTPPNPPQINRPGSSGRGGIGPIESRYYQIRHDPRGIGTVDPTLRAFLQRDVPWLINVAQAADQMARALNAEDYRKAVSQLMAAVQHA